MHTTVAPQDRWFVGLRFSTSRGAVGRHYYVVGDAADAEGAVRTAMRRAAEDYECAARDNAAIDGVEVRRLRWSPLGWAYLCTSDTDAGAPLCRIRGGEAAEA
ncbi:hypothetical protein [Streptomyces sp. NPDC026673]|uniref:hypothetical protein n=1 Tax=Streptomyces sp. NPDC026673 TaxID=3155724 RepID=UPI0033F01930